MVGCILPSQRPLAFWGLLRIPNQPRCDRLQQAALLAWACHILGSHVELDTRHAKSLKDKTASMSARLQMPLALMSLTILQCCLFAELRAHAVRKQPRVLHMQTTCARRFEATQLARRQPHIRMDGCQYLQYPRRAASLLHEMPSRVVLDLHGMLGIAAGERDAAGFALGANAPTVGFILPAGSTASTSLHYKR